MNYVSLSLNPTITNKHVLTFDLQVRHLPTDLVLSRNTLFPLEEHFVQVITKSSHANVSSSHDKHKSTCFDLLWHWPFSYGLGLFWGRSVLSRRTFLPSHFKINPRKCESEPGQDRTHTHTRTHARKDGRYSYIVYTVPTLSLKYWF